MIQTGEHRREDKAYLNRIRTYDLSELEDVYIHLDRTTFPQRFEMVRSELYQRLDALNSEEALSVEFKLEPSGFFRRIWAGFLDLFIHFLILVGLFVIGKVAMGLVVGFDSIDKTLGGEMIASFFLNVLEKLIQGDPKAWTNIPFWKNFGLALLVFFIYKGFLIVPDWVRSGSTPGMREVGVCLKSVDGATISRKQALIRFCAQHLLLLLTINLSGFWMIWDQHKQTLHDKLSGTQIFRVH